MLAIFRSIWAILDRPIWGTQHRSQWVYVEGRLTKIQTAIVFGLGGVAVMLLGKLLLPKFGKLVDNFLNENICAVGWFGWSLSGEVLFFTLVGISAPIIIGAIIISFRNGLRIYKSQSSLPIGYKPLFRTRLFEGKHAIFFGVIQVSLSGFLLILFGFLFTYSYYPLSIHLLKSTSTYEQCSKH